ncbi:5-formaminoimidazole-4-carboxamide-1-(beta)-D-ribofuranosyl 5'-monophosphate synthetase [Candidatus Curtissbacteria bacterium RIFCSPLOWO2_01_FULL_41_18]|uniref:5-formaminoimidazole-4-carboxamide-1-(Beta)-D-ribofuranosyl 5'-monophosphate synthetase n=2 Tax=Candidatus Curtissiibacteriota TaxID=1752717 RepID=A0A1F5G2Q0_9BACT|nr:MAG: 5-formaminoimidazole-4-carboxamide-1-(beta)-D-ribofuranosyl 5'-monophosphate synthetase [Candidatus Curtissbacteria bacterium RIFCSPHIGHO2_01_FULL_41_13]OGE05433.1 MAG: 5-formaminoimidazole-4-carboxamide-1-(beta)-D-ribofuranosyl 5'-monophosphate synthetase [Candidatus Curtissbacteria bacterium RIFCSPLOWO2_01_FULL_41_18]
MGRLNIKYKISNIRNTKAYTIAVIGSHSALDICRGAKEEGFKTLVIVEKGRDKTYAKYFKTRASLGCVDEVLYVDKFKDIILPKFQKILKSKNCIFIPHRSFEVYVNDYNAIENDFEIPIFGNKKLLRFEERAENPNQYNILEKANIKYPKKFKDPKDINTIVIVKVNEKERKYERAFFLAHSPEQHQSESERLIKEGVITKKDLSDAIIEEFILGVQVNFNFFYSIVDHRLELVGTDTRRQTDIEGILKLPVDQQSELFKIRPIYPQYEEAGHIAVTVLESMLEPAFEIGEKFVKATEKMVKPGVIGPFALQAVITPGPPKKEIIVFDVSPRMPGSPGIFATPYSGYLYGHSISMGRRAAMEIKAAIKNNKLEQIVT